MMTDQSIAALIRRLARALKREESYVSRLVTGGGDTLDRLDAGNGLTLRRVNRIIANVHARWPDAEPWPADIPRPTTKQEDAA